MQLNFVLKKEHILQICLFLGFFNFIARGTYIVICACLFFFLFDRKIQIKIDGLFLSLIVWATAFVLCASGFAGLGRVLTPVAGVLCFLVGQAVIKKETMYSDFKKYYFLVALAMMLHGLINMFLNVRHYGWSFGGERALIDLWATTDVLATGQSTLFLLMSAVLYYLIVFAPRKPVITYVAMIVAIVLGVVYNIMSASRFILYITLASLALSVFVHTFHRRTEKKLKPFFIAISVFAVLFVLYNANTFGVRSWVETSALADRLGRLEESGIDTALTSSARKKQIQYVMSNITLYFTGGRPTGLPFVHNTWLSVLNSGGLLLELPFLLFTVFLLIVGIKQVKNCPREHSVLVFGALLGIYAYMYLEPLFEGARLLFFAIALIAGMMSKIEALRKTPSVQGMEMEVS